MSKQYIGFKMVTATEQKRLRKEGYSVTFPDGCQKWIPKTVFEKNYLQIGENNTITQECVESFIKSIEASTIGEKTTLVRVTLANGFELIEASTCVDPANYNEEFGSKICVQKIVDKVWAHLGFLLQTAINGIK